MIKIIFFLILVAMISLGAGWIVENNGTMDVVWLGYKIKTSMSFFIFSLTFLIIFLIIFLQVIYSIISIPSRVNKKYKDFQLEQNLKNLQIGYAALLSGDVSQAKKLSQKLIANTPEKNKALMNLSEMLAAKVAQEEGNLASAQDYFSKFLDKKKHKFFAIKGMLDSAFKQGDIDSAIEYAEEAYRIKPNVKDGAYSLLQLYNKAEKFDKAEEFLKKYRRKHTLFKDKSNNIDVDKELSEVWFKKAKGLYEDADGFRSVLEQARKYVEKSLHYNHSNSEYIILMMRICKELKNERKAREVIEKAWKTKQSYEIGVAYLDVLSSMNYKDVTKKKLKAISGLQEISLNPEILEKLRDKVYDIEIEY